MSKLGNNADPVTPAVKSVLGTPPVESKRTISDVVRTKPILNDPGQALVDDFERLRPIGSDKSATKPTKLEDLSPEQRKILDQFRESLRQTLGEELRSTLGAHKAYEEATEKDRLLKGIEKGSGVLPLQDGLNGEKQRALRDALIEREQEEIEARQKEERERLEKGLAALNLAAKQAKAEKGEPSKARVDSWLDTVHGDDASGLIAESLQPQESIEDRVKRLAEAERRLKQNLRMVDRIHEERLALSTNRRRSLSDDAFDDIHTAAREAILAQAGNDGIGISSSEQTTVPTIISMPETASITDDDIRLKSNTPLGNYLGIGPNSAVGRAIDEKPVEVHHDEGGGMLLPAVNVPFRQYLTADQIAQLKYLAGIHATDRLATFRNVQQLAVTKAPLAASMNENPVLTISTASSTPTMSPANSSDTASPGVTPASSVASLPSPIQPVGPVGAEPTLGVPGIKEDDVGGVTGSELGGDDGDIDDGASGIGNDGTSGIDDGASDMGDNKSVVSDLQ
jgi:hypothetical protein